MRRTKIWVSAILFALAAGLGQASYLESDYAGEAPPPRTVLPPAPPPRRIIPPPVSDNPLADMIRNLTVQQGYHYRGLTVFPVVSSRVTQPQVYLSVEEALAHGDLLVEEKGRGAVPVLIVENTGHRPVLMLGGELLLGGRQNRVLREDVLLPAGSGPVEVPVLCIEQGRWSGRVTRFESRKSLAPFAVRGAAQAGRSQGEIWEGVSGYQQRFDVDSETQDLQAIQDSPEISKALGEYREEFARHCWRSEQVGMVVARWGRIVGADVFCNAAMFRKHRDRLLESYALDCIAYEAPDMRHKVAVMPGRDEAERFLRRALRAGYSWRTSPGLGRLLSLSGAGLSGSALVHRDDVLHGCLLAEGEVIVPIARPMPEPRLRLEQTQPESAE